MADLEIHDVETQGAAFNEADRRAKIVAGLAVAIGGVSAGNKAPLRLALDTYSRDEIAALIAGGSLGGEEIASAAESAAAALVSETNAAGSAASAATSATNAATSATAAAGSATTASGHATTAGTQASAAAVYATAAEGSADAADTSATAAAGSATGAAASALSATGSVTAAEAWADSAAASAVAAAASAAEAAAGGYTNTEIDGFLAAKATATTVYTKTEADALLADKADASAMTTALAAKADSSAMTTALAAKADSSAMTTALAAKASLTGAETLTNKTLEAVLLSNGVTEESYSFNTGTTTGVDLANGSVQDATLTGNWTPSAWPTPALGKSLVLFTAQDATGGRVVTWPSSVKWPGNVAPTITSTASKVDIFGFIGRGSYWHGVILGQLYL